MGQISGAVEDGEQKSRGNDSEGASERAGHHWKQAAAKHRLLKNRTQNEAQEINYRHCGHDLVAEMDEEHNAERRCDAGDWRNGGVEDIGSHPPQGRHDWQVMAALEDHVQNDAQEDDDGALHAQTRSQQFRSRQQMPPHAQANHRSQKDESEKEDSNIFVAPVRLRHPYPWS
jgi:hypothetical protein